MLERFIDFLVGTPASGALPAIDPRVALAALLVEAARADGDYAATERQMIDRLLMRSYALDAPAAARLREAGEAAQADSADLVRFTRAIKEAVPFEHRVEVIEQIWRVVYADGDRNHLESALVRQLAGLLYVGDVECGLARQRVADRRG